ncbi:MAG TPA: zinc metalloprotease HtpX [Gemmatimonadaceae bacterium]
MAEFVSNSSHPLARTALLMAALIALLGIGGWAFAGQSGFLLFAGLGLVMNFLAYWFSDRIALRSNQAQPLPREQAPEVYEIVERLSRQAGIPTPPIYFIPSDSPNAFATGRGPQHSAVAVTRGLLARLDAREVEGVLAHELSHVRNRDVLVATIAAGLAGVISSIGYIMQWGIVLGGGGRRRGGTSALAALAWIIVAPIIAMLLRLAISRAREYGADASGARLTRDPASLADALERLDAESERQPYEYAGPATSHLFIVNPLRGGNAKLLSWLATHPPIQARVARLRAMTV